MTRTHHRRATARLTAPLVLGLALGLGVSPAEASTTRKTDAHGDVAGGDPSSPDLAQVELRRTGKDRIRITFRAHGPINAPNITDPGGLAVEFRRDARTIRSVRITAVDGVLRGRVCSYDARRAVPTATDCSRVHAEQVDVNTLRAVVPLAKVKRGARVLRWYASAFDTSVFPFAIDSVGEGAKKPYRWRL